MTVKKKNKKAPKKHHFVHKIEEKIEEIDVLEKIGGARVVAKKVKSDSFLKRDLIKFSTISLIIVAIIVAIYVISMRFDVLSFIFEKIGI